MMTGGSINSSGSWMSRQGLHRRKGHRDRSATAIFPGEEVPAAHLIQPAGLAQALARREEGLVGS